MTFEQLTLTGSAINLTDTVFTSKCLGAVITVNSGSVRWRCDGTTPDASTGHLATLGTTINLESFDEVNKFMAIGTAELAISYTVKD